MKKAVGKPYANTKLVEFLERRILELRPVKSQIAIASEAGFTAVNMMAMIKNGSSRLPLDRVPALARALDTDPARLLRLALEQQDGALAQTVENACGHLVTANEAAWLAALREASDGTDPHLTTKALKAIRGIFGK